VPTLSSQEVSPHLYQVTVTIPLEKDDFILKDHLAFSTDHPAVKIVDTKVQTEATDHYSATFKETKKIYPTDLIAHLTIQTTADSVPDAHLHISYYQNSHKKITQEYLPLALGVQEIETPHSINSEPTPLPQEPSAPASSTRTSSKSTITTYLSELFTTTSSWWLRLLLSFVIGLLLSLTPCIYPMIPITVGILQAQGKKSMWYNFLLALCYTMGIATTFASLGLAAAVTGSLFGSILNNPIIILTIVAFFVYLAGTMLGLYDMYMPRFLQSGGSASQGGSPLSAFIFGAVSGTIASPCLTPGLLFLLTYVAQIQSLVMGFLLLFVFGIGTSVPLLIVGTFSNAIHFLPNAGMWMIEVKRLFGFILLGMSIYFLQGLLPTYILWFLLALLIAVAGTYYIYEATHSLTVNTSRKRFFGIALVMGSFLITAKSYIAFGEQYYTTQSSIWLDDYQIARDTACQQDKQIVLFLSGPYCSICKMIEKKFFTNKTVINALSNRVLVKIKDTEQAGQPIQDIIKRYNIRGVPTLLVLNAKNEEVVQQWGSELYDQSIDEFVDQLS
jgi:thiol:disulfide interchange protein DsbD